MSRRNKKYTPEFRTAAVRLVREGVKTLREIAQDLGVPMTTMHQWVMKEREVASQDPKNAEVDQLRRELEAVKMERDFLKKAAAFFAKNQA